MQLPRFCVLTNSAVKVAAATSKLTGDGDGVLPAAHGALGPWQRTPAGDGGIDMVIVPVSRGRAGGGDEGGGRSGGLRHHPSRLLLLFEVTKIATTDADGQGAQQHHLDIFRGKADGSPSELSGSV
jgi:hypothetical protein